MSLGEELDFITDIRFAGRGQLTAPRTYKAIAGSYLSVNVIAGSVAPDRLTALQSQLIATKLALESNDPAQIGTLTREQLKQFNLQVGVLSSALEHATPEQMFNTDPTNPPDAISAVKALAKASAAGQRIYQITQANQSSILPNIHHDPATMAEIRASLAVGKTVITHTDVVSIPGGWLGAGTLFWIPRPMSVPGRSGVG